MANKRQGHFKLYAYVCGSGCVQYPDVDGTVTFTQVFMKHPPQCRYAVVGEWDAVTHSERVLVWDLEDTKLRGSIRLIPPTPIRVCDDVDQAIMATMMLYEE